MSFYHKTRKCVLYSDWSQFGTLSLLVTYLAPKHSLRTFCNVLSSEYVLYKSTFVTCNIAENKSIFYYYTVGYWNFIIFRMSGPPPPGYYPPPPHGQPGQHPPAPPGQVYPQVSISLTCLLVLQKMKLVLWFKLILVFFSKGLYSSCI